MSERFLEKNVAITGIGQSAFGRPSKSSTLELTVDACLQAIADAGLQRSDIDGIASFPGELPDTSGLAPVGITSTMLALNLKVNWHSAINRESPSQLGSVFAAAAAIAAGFADHVLVFRTIGEASAWEHGKEGWATRHAHSEGAGAPRVGGTWQWMMPFNAYSATPWFAMYARYHFDRYGTRPEQLAQIALNARRNAQGNPNAVYRKPMTLDDYMGSRMIADPLRLYDCDVPIDGCTAFVLSRKDMARHMRNPPIRLEAIGSALRHRDTWMRPESFEAPASSDAAAMMWNRTLLKPSDVDVAQLYDGFSIHTLYWLESLGFCKRGEAGAFIEGGHRIAREGELPLNTGGGQLSGGRWHGLGHLHEACTQLWGRGGERQVTRDPKVAVVANGAAAFVGCMLVVRD